MGEQAILGEISSKSAVSNGEDVEYLRAKLTRVLVRYFGGDDRRIEHALRVLHHADQLLESRPGCDSDIVIASALLHDIGIRVSEEKHGYNNGQTQEEYGPPIAEELLSSIGFPAEKIEIVKNIIGNHHSPSRYDTRNCLKEPLHHTGGI